MAGSDLDLLVTGGTLATSERVFPASIAVRQGRIAGILQPGDRPMASAEIDARGLHILPGVIDTHVHTRDPGVPEREDFLSGTMAAAAGGITTLIEMPISKLPVHSADTLTRRAATVQPRALIDFAFYGGAGQENLDTIVEQADAGVVGFKTFLQGPPPARCDEFVGLWATDQAALRDVMAAVARTGLPHCFHCENAPMIEALQARLVAAGRVVGIAHAESRPAIVEDTSVAMILALADEAGGRVHVVHLSSPRAAGLIKAARARGLPVTAETCPQYLFLTAEALTTFGPFAKCNPAFRSPDDVEALWPYLSDGTIDVVGSDHSPFLLEEKERGWTNIFEAPPGLTGLEVMVPLMLDACAAGRLELQRVAWLLSSRAARLFDLPAKGDIAPGFDADLTLVDLAAAWTFDAARSFSRAPHNMRAYDGRRLRGRVVSTIVRGVRVYHEGEITAAPGYGRWVRPPRGSA